MIMRLILEPREDVEIVEEHSVLVLVVVGLVFVLRQMLIRIGILKIIGKKMLYYGMEKTKTICQPMSYHKKK